MDTIKIRALINQGIIDTITHKLINGASAEIYVTIDNETFYCEKRKAFNIVGATKPSSCIKYIICGGCMEVNICRKQKDTLINFN